MDLGKLSLSIKELVATILVHVKECHLLVYSNKDYDITPRGVWFCTETKKMTNITTSLNGSESGPKPLSELGKYPCKSPVLYLS